MKISDILGMSLTNLWRRKTRTVLTVLGVIIGTASIVVMLSLGIGLKQAMLAQVGTAGGLTEIIVSSDGDTGAGELLLGDSTMDTFLELDHVEKVEPQIWYNMPVQAGKYEGEVSILGVSQEYLNEIELGEGTVPKSGGGVLSMIAGSQVVSNFMDSTTGEYFFMDDQELPDIDLINMPLVGGIEVDSSGRDDNSDTASNDSEDYVDPAFSDDSDDFDSTDDAEETDDSLDDNTNDFDNSFDTLDGDSGFGNSDFLDGEESYSYFTSTMKRVQIKVTGITVEDEGSYSDVAYNCYTDLESLKAFLKQNYSVNDVIPGQPTDRDGKPYRDLKYTQLTVKVDDSSNVEEVLQEIQNMGYRAEANKEWLEEIEKEFMIIEAVLGGIGAVAMLVAAISIANTMTMSTYERTKEIGVMKVLGCSLGNIRSMFLAEAAFIGFLGGIAGLLLSGSLSFVLNKAAPVIMTDFSESTKISQIPLWLSGLAIVFATLIGMIAGFFPAQRATKLSPLAAIRNE